VCSTRTGIAQRAVGMIQGGDSTYFGFEALAELPGTDFDGSDAIEPRTAHLRYLAVLLRSLTAGQSWGLKGGTEDDSRLCSDAE
jgi:hypothetical protein